MQKQKSRLQRIQNFLALLRAKETVRQVQVGRRRPLGALRLR
jgi:hypothetical protein